MLCSRWICWKPCGSNRERNSSHNSISKAIMSVKYKLVPADILDQTVGSSTRTLITLNKELESVLNNKRLSDQEKYIKYMTKFVEYLDQRSKQTDSKRQAVASLNVSQTKEHPKKPQEPDELMSTIADKSLQSWEPSPTRKLKRTKIKEARKNQAPYKLRKRHYDYEITE